MNHDRSKPQRPVSLEDILRLKRAERPPAEFWSQFDRELRAKQLAALVEKRPWWRTISFTPAFFSLRRYYMPLGATAVLAATFFSVRGLQHSSAPSAAPASDVVAAPARELISAPAVATSPAPSSSTVIEPMPVAATPSAVAVADRPVDLAISKAERLALSSDATPPGGFVQMIALVGSPTSTDEAALAPGTRLVADNFAALQDAEPAFAREFVAPERGFEARALPARNRPVEPLAQMRVPSGSRRAALIAQATLVSTPAPVLSSDRAARSLSDERLYDQISRVNARGAGVNMKF